MKKALFAALLLILPSAAMAQPPKKDCGELPPGFEGIAFAGDGDTIYGVGLRPGIRLWGSNAPELRDDKTETVAGMRARAFTADRLAEAGNKVSCQAIEWDAYCRMMATCTAGGKDLTLELLKAGLSYGFYLAKHPAHVDQALTYSNAEAEARKAGKGLWPMWLGASGR
jgi:endonuclease YncB( thermonuclease family)